MEIEQLLKNTIESMRSVIDVNNVIGAPIRTAEGAILIPVSKVSFGFVSGAGEYSESQPKVKSNSLPSAGGSGGGVNITPIGFLVVANGDSNFIKVDKETSDNKWAELMNAAMNVLKEYQKD